jgi:hypothetical protein
MMPKVDDSEAIVVGGVEGVGGVECGTQEQGQSNIAADPDVVEESGQGLAAGTWIQDANGDVVEKDRQWGAV